MVIEEFKQWASAPCSNGAALVISAFVFVILIMFIGPAIEAAAKRYTDARLKDESWRRR